MTKVRFVTRSAKGRVRSTTDHPSSLGQSGFRAVFSDARPMGHVPGDPLDPLNLVLIAQLLDRKLRSTGGRPALADAQSAQLRVSLMQGDREKIEAIRAKIGPQSRLRPSAAQMVAVLCHLALARIPPDELSASVARLAEQDSNVD